MSDLDRRDQRVPLLPNWREQRRSWSCLAQCSSTWRMPLSVSAAAKQMVALAQNRDGRRADQAGAAGCSGYDCCFSHDLLLNQAFLISLEKFVLRQKLLYRMIKLLWSFHHEEMADAVPHPEIEVRYKGAQEGFRVRPPEW